jgi:hypothetical protein
MFQSHLEQSRRRDDVGTMHCDVLWVGHHIQTLVGRLGQPLEVAEVGSDLHILEEEISARIWMI